MTLRSITDASRATTLRMVVLRLITLIACTAMTLSLSACTSDEGTDKQSSGTESSSNQTVGSVAVFTPSDGVTISGNTPLNKWTKFVPALTDALREEGFAKKHITTSSADSLDKQSRDIQDYVVNHVSAANSSSTDGTAANSADDVTLIVAPVTSADDTTRQYGDYVSATITTATSDTANNSTSSDDATSDEHQALERLTSALTLAQENGMHVIMLASTITGFQPNAYVRMSTAEMIGTIQALKLVNKLALDTVSKDNPKNIEVLVPYTPQSSANSGVGAVLGLPSADDDDESAEPTEEGAQFAQEVFAGAWSVLQPYFKSGKAVSSSGLLTADTTADDWHSVAFACTKQEDAGVALRKRLAMTSRDDTHTRIDGIIAMNDYTAAGVVKELADLGYTGSAADINPSITISGIVENITGKKDLQRSKVPDPIKAPETDTETSKDSSTDNSDADSTVEQTNARWPIVTGYGAYVDVMPQIVAGQQWMTATEDRASLAKDTAQACRLLNAGTALTSSTLSALSSSKVNGKDTSTISEDLLAVSAYNLKAALIDPGYITLAEAGL
ncbi:hypothetical protein BHAP_0761 [Bifidobacterium hapali]|uniref:Periplasmic binding protein domain-containing protein n=2 Tax=Bifidobacterium hapali TaxID=1630172 RepID=A0A261G0P8_9BIFI|nr:hypothetical protein BHAP_0761 [Bifidobacterium hapali]